MGILKYKFTHKARVTQLASKPGPCSPFFSLVTSSSSSAWNWRCWEQGISGSGPGIDTWVGVVACVLGEEQASSAESYRYTLWNPLWILGIIYIGTMLRFGQSPSYSDAPEVS